MKKLNNKGFAISTMLYSILTLITITLMILLNIMRTSHNKETSTTDQIYSYLNKCNPQQIALEENDEDKSITEPNRCSDQYEAYITCTNEDKATNAKNLESLSNVLKSIADADSTNLKKDNYVNNRYIYVGNNDNVKNHIKIGNKKGRIISLEPNKTIKIKLENQVQSVFDKKIITTPENDETYNENSKKAWINSILYNNLKKDYESLTFKDKLVKDKFYTGLIYETDDIDTVLNSIRDEYDTNTFGIITLEDYLKASSSSTCNLKNLSENKTSIEDSILACKENNWINNYSTCTWTNTAVTDQEINKDNPIDTYVTFSTSSIEPFKSFESECITNMVIYLSSKAAIDPNKGDGSVSNPYIIE